MSIFLTDAQGHEKPEQPATSAPTFDDLTAFIQELEAACRHFGTKDSNKRLFRKAALWLVNLSREIVYLRRQLRAEAQETPTDGVPADREA